jgi:NhaA family Na+:H+ antiporter
LDSLRFPKKAKPSVKAMVHGFASGVHTNLWEFHAEKVTEKQLAEAQNRSSVPTSNGKWLLTHRYGTGLEVDLGREAEQDGHGSRVQLPVASLRGMRELMESLQHPEAILLEGGWDGMNRGDVFDLLLEQLTSQLRCIALCKGWDAISSQQVDVCLCRKDALAAIKTQRPTFYDAETQSNNSERLAQALPAVGADKVDVSIVPVGQGAPVSPVVTLVRLPGSADHRYAALVLCAASDFELGQEVGRALATVFLEPTFVRVALTADEPEQLVEAIHEHFSHISIVPTVFLENAENAVSDAQLGDTLVDSIEKFILKQQGKAGDGNTKRHRSKGSQNGAENSMRSVVMVTERSVQGEGWLDSCLVNSGLELDLQQKGARPRMPHANAHALTDVRRLLMPASVALSVDSSTPDSVVKTAVGQLARVGLPPHACEEVTSALADCLARVPQTVPKSRVGVLEELWETTGLESCHVLALTTKHLIHNHTIGAFLRFQSVPQFDFPAVVETKPRLLVVLVGPDRQADHVSEISKSLAALVADEALMRDLVSVKDPVSFVTAVDSQLSNIKVMPQAHLTPAGLTNGLSPDQLSETDSSAEPEEAKSFDLGTLVQKAIKFAQKCSLPLILGVLTALVWSNIDMHSYHAVTHEPLWEGAQMLGHTLSLHFVVNDIFMCFFFGLAIMEVTEALLPGGSLYPIKRAINPLIATCGGVVGPAAAYMVAILVFWYAGSFEGQMCESATGATSAAHRLLSADPAAGSGHGSGGGDPAVLEQCSLGLLLNGWGVPTATDISLAWMFARLIFGNGHPAVNFLLLLAIVDDALGMLIIAVVYVDPLHPVEPLWLLLVLVGAVLAFFMRKLTFPPWQCYIFFAFPFAWLGLLKAHVHPALALVPIVPFMPASHVDHDQDDSHCHQQKLEMEDDAATNEGKSWGQQVTNLKRSKSIIGSASQLLAKFHGEHAPLHVFAHTMQLPVDFGMFFFGLSNAGVALNNFGGLTISVVFALIVGKTLGIAGFALLAHVSGFHLPLGVSKGDLFTMGCLGGIGLTVALFMSNEAFMDPGLQGQAKFGSVLSVFAAAVAVLLRRLQTILAKKQKEDVNAPEVSMDLEKEESVVLDKSINDIMVEDVTRMFVVQRQYKKRGVEVGIEKFSVGARLRAKDLEREVSARSGTACGQLRAEAAVGTVVRQMSEMSRDSKKGGNAVIRQMSEKSRDSRRSKSSGAPSITPGITVQLPVILGKKVVQDVNKNAVMREL